MLLLMKKKMATNSSCCCGKSYYEATRIISIIDLILFTLFFLLLSSILYLVLFSPETLESLSPFKDDVHKFLERRAVIRMYIIISFMVWTVGEVGFGVLLYFGATKRSYGMLRAWIFLIIVDCLFAMMAFIQFVVSTDSFVFFVLLAISYYTYRFCSLWTVHGFLRDVVTDHVPWV